MFLKKKIIILGIISILWCIVIFYASSRTSIESNNKSKEIIYKVTKKVVSITNHFHITNIDVKDEKWFIKTVNRLNKPLRKGAHAFVYFILGILLCLLLKCFPLSKKMIWIIVILFCFCYSLTDEYHQTLVEGRTGQLIDCLIDTTGGVCGIALVELIKRRKEDNHEKRKINCN